MNTYLKRWGGLTAGILLFGLAFSGCGDGKDTAADQAEAVQEAASEATTETVTEVVAELTAAEEALVTQVATIASALEKAPAAAAEAILEKSGMTVEEYEAAVYKIASSPALSAAFEKAQQ